MILLYNIRGAVRDGHFMRYRVFVIWWLVFGYMRRRAWGELYLVFLAGILDGAVSVLAHCSARITMFSSASLTPLVEHCPNGAPPQHFDVLGRLEAGWRRAMLLQLVPIEHVVLVRLGLFCSIVAAADGSCEVCSHYSISPSSRAAVDYLCSFRVCVRG